MAPKSILSLCDLEALMPYATDKDRIQYLPLLNEVCATFQINTPPRISIFFAQLEVLTDELKNISPFNENLLASADGIIEHSIANMFYPFAFLWSTKDCNSNADVGLIGLITKKLCGSYDKSEEKLKIYHRNKQYFK